MLTNPPAGQRYQCAGDQLPAEGHLSEEINAHMSAFERTDANDWMKNIKVVPSTPRARPRGRPLRMHRPGPR